MAGEGNALTRHAFVAVLIAAALLIPIPLGTARADSETDAPDYGVPSLFALPWACDEAVRVTWRPEDHWADGKATGVAFDFSMVEGTPLFAPASGTAYFLRDERDRESHLGNYVDIVTEDGQWKVRLAHLRDEQSGQRDVRAGEFVGYSGMTGASAAHLHLEMFVREGERWARPDLSQMSSVFGLDVASLLEDAYILNDRCAAALALERAPAVDDVANDGAAPYGEDVSVALALRNEGIEDATVERVGVSLVGPSGRSYSGTLEGPWHVAGKEGLDLNATVHAAEAGRWEVTGVVVTADGELHTLDAEGAFTVGAPPVTLVGLSAPLSLELGEPLAIEAWLENGTGADAVLPGLYVAGTTHRGEPWVATVEHTVVVPGGALRRVVLRASDVPRTAGEWIAAEVGYGRGERPHVLSRADCRFLVEGPELVIRHVGGEATPRGLEVLLFVTNVGTRVAAPERIDLWGIGPEAEGWHVELDGAALGVLHPGQARMLRLPAGSPGPTMDGHLQDAGYWASGTYHAMRLLPFVTRARAASGAGGEGAP